MQRFRSHFNICCSKSTQMCPKIEKKKKQEPRDKAEAVCEQLKCATACAFRQSNECGANFRNSVEENFGEQIFRVLSEMRGKFLYIDPKN